MFYVVKQDEHTGLFDLIRVMGTFNERIGRYVDLDLAEKNRIQETLKYERRDEFYWD
jgi:hypothetical protein